MLSQVGATDEVEVEWIELRSHLENAQAFEGSLSSKWNYQGYQLFDQRKNYGLALFHLVEFTRSGTSIADRADRLFTLLVYSALHADSLWIVTICLKDLLNLKSSLGKRRLGLIKDVLMEYLADSERPLPLDFVHTVETLFEVNAPLRSSATLSNDLRSLIARQN